MVVKNKFKNFSLKIILKVDRQTSAYKSHLSVVTLILSCHKNDVITNVYIRKV